MPGGTVSVKHAGKASSPAVIYADRNSSGTLANPYTTANGQVEFYLAGQVAVDVTVTPAGGSAATIMNQQAADAVPQHQTLTGFGGKVLNWFLS